MPETNTAEIQVDDRGQQKEIFQKRVEERVHHLSNAQLVTAESLIDTGAPEAAASYLATQEAIGDLFGSGVQKMLKLFLGQSSMQSEV